MKNGKQVVGNFDAVALAISTATDNEQLDHWAQVIKMRKQELARVSATSLRKGQEIKFNDRIRPTYPRGLTATVKNVNRESVTVDCPEGHQYGRFSGHKHVRVPLSLIEF